MRLELGQWLALNKLGQCEFMKRGHLMKYFYSLWILSKSGKPNANDQDKK